MTETRTAPDYYQKARAILAGEARRGLTTTFAEKLMLYRGCRDGNLIWRCNVYSFTQDGLRPLRGQAGHVFYAAPPGTPKRLLRTLARFFFDEHNDETARLCNAAADALSQPSDAMVQAAMEAMWKYPLPEDLDRDIVREMLKAALRAAP